MPYAFVNLIRVQGDDFRKPDLPEGTSYLLLADGRATTWNLYDYSLDEANEDWRPEHPAGSVLSALISSGMRYPPALALARDEMSRRFRTHEPSVEEFEDAMVESLSRHLSDQFDAGYMLVQARVEEIGYLHVPEWQWVLGLSTKDPSMVRWVSDDYFVYCNPISNFVFSDAQLRALRGE